MFSIHPLIDDRGTLCDPTRLQASMPVHRQLRPSLPENPAAYRTRLEQIFAGGARMTVACDATRPQQVVSVALWRIIENTYEGRRFYVDDLVTDQAVRSRGAGRALLAALQVQARALGCDTFALDSGVQRFDAHHFYFREGLRIASYAFRKELTA